MNCDQLLLDNMKMIQYLIYKKSGDWKLSEDLSQDFWIKVQRSLDKGKTFNSENGFKWFLVTCARNLLTDHYRTNIKRESSFSSYNYTDQGWDTWWSNVMLYDYDESVEDQMIHQDLIDQNVKNVERLPDHWRFVYELHVVGEMRFIEIAEIMETSLSNVLGFMRYARKQLKTELK